MYGRILIAQRGEAAARVARTCKRLGVTAVAVRTGTADEAVHVDACDESLVVEANEDGTLSPATIVDAAKRAEADAVHAGYADTRAQAALSAAFEDQPATFVGMASEPLTALLDRQSQRELAERADVRHVDGRRVEGAAAAANAANEIGYPVVVRHDSVGTEGPLVVVQDEEDIGAAVAECEPGTLTVEQWIERPRILEVVCLADDAGAVEPLCELECSIGVSGLRLLEESPSPELHNRSDGAAVREAMFDASIRIAQAAGARGIFITRFVLDADSRLFFVGARAGLPVQHGIVEMVTGLDLVELMLCTAAGEANPERVAKIQPSGHAFGAWLLAPSNETFAEGTTELHFPPFPQGMVRVECSAALEAAVPVDDRPRIGKVTTFTPLRHQSLLLLDRVLAASRIAPYQSNIKLLRRVLGDETFRAGQYDAEFIVRLLVPGS